MAQAYQTEDDENRKMAEELNRALEEIGRLKKRLDATEKDLDTAYKWGAGLSLTFFTALTVVTGLFLVGIF